MDNRIKIRDCIQAGRISEATALVHQLHPELLDDDRYLFFHLQVGSLHTKAARFFGRTVKISCGTEKTLNISYITYSPIYSNNS